MVSDASPISDICSQFRYLVVLRLSTIQVCVPITTVVGLDKVEQQIPRAVIAEPSSDKISPPETMELVVMFVTAVVVIVGNTF